MNTVGSAVYHCKYLPLANIFHSYISCMGWCNRKSGGNWVNEYVAERWKKERFGT